MSVEMESLSSILGDTPFSKGEDPAPPADEPKEVIAEPEKVAEVVKETNRDESGRFAPKAEPKTEKPKLQPEDVPALIQLRRRAQEAEERLKQYEASKPKPDIWEDPEKFVNSKLQEVLSPLESRLLDLQVENARLKNPDFDEAMMAFLESAQKDPNLSALADNSPNPLQFIYREGKRLKELGPYDGDLNKRDEAKFGELKGEVAKRDQQIAAMQAQLDQLTKTQTELAAVPRSLNKLAGSSPKTSDADPEDLNSIVRFK